MGHWLASPHKIPRGDWRPVRCGEPESHPTPIRPPRSARTQSRTDPSEYIPELQVAARVVFAAVGRAERYLSRTVRCRPLAIVARTNVRLHKIPPGGWRLVRCGEPENHPTPLAHNISAAAPRRRPLTRMQKSSRH